MHSQDLHEVSGVTNAMPLDYVRVALQYLYPKHLLSGLIFRLMRIRYKPIKDRQIRWFTKRYQVDLKIALQPDPAAYPDFNAFFTRALRAEVRPITSDEQYIASPVDGEISQGGDITNGRLLQAKGHTYSLENLLGGDAERCNRLANGKFLTVYLAPKDYHRIHSPISGRLLEMVYVPGDLFSVNQSTTRIVPNLFARNERVVCLFATNAGLMAVVMVGAVLVGSIETVWAGTVTPARPRRKRIWRYDGSNDEPIRFKKGEEIGRFNMGSTVIVILPGATSRWNAEVRPGRAVMVGAPIGRLIGAEGS